MASSPDVSMATKRSQLGSVSFFMFGSGIWMLLTVSSIIIIFQQHPRRPLWGLTLAFLIVTLVVNSAYLGLVEQMAEIGALDVQSLPIPSDIVLPGFPGCSTQGIAASALSTASVLLNDAFFLYRAYILFKKQLLYMLCPVMLYMGLIAMGITTSIRCVVDNLLVKHVIISTAFDTISLVLNILLATMIVFQILLAQRHLKIIDQHQMAGCTNTRYFTTIGIIIESAFAWTLFGLLFIVARSAGSSPSAVVFGTLFEMSGKLSPVLVIFRILINKHYCRKTEPDASTPSPKVKIYTGHSLPWSQC